MKLDFPRFQLQSHFLMSYFGTWEMCLFAIEKSPFHLWWFEWERPPSAHIFMFSPLLKNHLWRISRWSLAGVRVTSLEEVCNWGAGLWDFKSPHQAQSAACGSGYKALSYCSSTMPAPIMLSDMVVMNQFWNRELLKLNTFHFKFPWLWCLFPA